MSVGWLTFRVVFPAGIPSIPGLFAMNKQLQEQGYYMAEFEFKMLAIAYFVDRGRYSDAYSMLSKLHAQMKSGYGFLKVPKFANKDEEFEFYLNLQSPQTGAFMDDDYPFCVYTGPTGNVLNHLDALASATGRPLKLKYPLKYLDGISTPERLLAYLDDIGTVGWPASTFPQTSFHLARDLLSLIHEDCIVEKHGLYRFSPEWKKTLLKWFYDNQDPKTGLWGPKSKNGTLVKQDTQNSASILKVFVDKDGNDIHPDFPLRYQDALAVSFLKGVDRIPDDDEFDRWHEWNLNTSKSIKMLTKCFWLKLSANTKCMVKKLIEDFIKVIFDKFYIRSEGSFSYYPNSEHATIDGAGVISSLNAFGYSSEENQARLWGNPASNCSDLGCSVVADMKETDIQTINGHPDINSIRLYADDPGQGSRLFAPIGVYYTGRTSVLDALELIPKMRTWIGSTSQCMGNWTSKEDVAQSLSEMPVKTVPIFEGNVPIPELDQALKGLKRITLVGFDVLQVPRCKKMFVLRETR
jgi:hypothetical protein